MVTEDASGSGIRRESTKLVAYACEIAECEARFASSIDFFGDPHGERVTAALTRRSTRAAPSTMSRGSSSPVGERLCRTRRGALAMRRQPAVRNAASRTATFACAITPVLLRQATDRTVGGAPAGRPGPNALGTRLASRTASAEQASRICAAADSRSSASRSELPRSCTVTVRSNGGDHDRAVAAASVADAHDQCAPQEPRGSSDHRDQAERRVNSRTVQGRSVML